MRVVFGLLSIMLGLAVAIVWMPQNDSERQLTVVTSIATQGVGQSATSPARSPRTFSPNVPLIATVGPSDGAAPGVIAGVATLPAPPAVPTAGVVRPAIRPPPTAVLSHATASVIAPVGFAVPSLGGSSGFPAGRQSAQFDMGRQDLVRSLQRELRRVGCYYGEVDGDWGAGSRRAMIQFTERVNASLPTEQPDFILLTLVQGQTGTVCGRGCPSGQSLGDTGRCLPNAVVAQSRRTPSRGGDTLREDIVQATTSQTAAVVATPLPGRMSIGGPLTGGAYVDPLQQRSPAQAAVTLQPPPSEASVELPRTAERKERPRRTGQRTSSRYANAGWYAPPARYYAPRRSRSWTASFFGSP